MTNLQTTWHQWIETRARLVGKGLLGGAGASLSVRIPGHASMWFGTASDAAPMVIELNAVVAVNQAATHACVYMRREGIGAIGHGGGEFGLRVAAFGGRLPQLFDEQARHIGAMPLAVADRAELSAALASGACAIIVDGRPLCLGITSRRMALNAELFEKCATAYVMAAATGATITHLPWWVRAIANRRLVKDERRADLAYQQGNLPVESNSY